MNKTRTILSPQSKRGGKIKYALFGWLIGLPSPIIVTLLFLSGCDF